MIEESDATSERELLAQGAWFGPLSQSAGRRVRIAVHV
jgi:hypothetical protein